MNLKQVEQDKLINKLNKKLNYLKEKELTLDELKLKYDTLEKKVEENALNEVKMNEKDGVIDNIVNSMLEKFRKIEERLFNIEDQQPQLNDAFNNTSVEETCEECEYTTSSSADFEKHMKTMHGN